jgi:U6 snRNA-associated Sm-like protein LSm3
MNKFKVNAIEEPIDLVKRSLNSKVFLRCRDNREIKGYLHAFDKHFNMMLS